MEIQLTEGNVLKNLVRFSAPFLLSYFLQTLYGMADLFIAGQFNGADVITAVSVGSQIMHMLTVIIVGLAMGPAVLIGHAVGEKNKNRIRTLIFTSSILFLIIAFIFTILTILLCPQIVKILSTPNESIEQTKMYLYICFAGLPFIVAYNVIASIFRGLGDSKSPMIFVAIACFINIVLDYILIGTFGLKAEGAAIATIFAQAISVIISLLFVVAKNRKETANFATFTKNTTISQNSANSAKPAENAKVAQFSEDFTKRKSSTNQADSATVAKFSKKEAKEILKIGVPVACQDGFIQISFLLITVIANRRGVNVAAAVGIVEKIISFLFLVPSSMLSSVSAICAQNVGAKKMERANKTLLYAILIGFSFGLIIAILFQFLGKNVIGLFTSSKEVVRLGSQYIRTYVFDCVFAAIHFSFSGYFCAIGKSLYAFLHNAISIIFIRVPGAYFASVLFPETLLPMGLAATCGSLLSSIICVFIFAHLRKKVE